MAKRVIVLLSLCLAMLLPYAATTDSAQSATSAISGPLATWGGNCTVLEAPSGVLMGVIVPCIQRTVERVTTQMAREFSAFMMPIFMAFLTLVIVFYGLRIMQGEGAHKEAVFLIFKIGLVLAFVNNFAGLTPAVFDAITEGQNIIASTLGPKEIAQIQSGPVSISVSVGTQNLHCDVNKYRPSAPNGFIWAMMDCMLGKVMGFAIGGDGKPSMLLAASMLGMMGGIFFGGSFGFAVFFAILGFIISLFRFVLMVAFATLNSYILAGLYIIISPLFIPLALMRVTGQYFESWWKGLASAMLVPIVITAFTIVGLQVYDRLLLAPDSELEKLFDHAIFREAAQQQCTPRRLFGQGATNIIDSSRVALPDASMPSNERAITGIISQFHGNPGGMQICTPTHDWNRYSDNDDNREFFIGLMLEASKLLICSLVMMEALQQLMSRISTLTGKGSAGSVLSPQGQMEQNIAGAMNTARQRATQVMNRNYTPDELSEDELRRRTTIRNGQEHIDYSAPSGGVSGSDFLSRLGPSISAGGEGFISTLLGTRR